ncbi:uncharacterized protein PITG_10743 [Phytophthora infestans T30-4]|uniref:Beta-glucan synthesis-associated protein n=1 Tax=Phytophthora infestans (strain T30-4) TaxID=403677 RepID=D0NGZ4_PHYIT|nr:uncharacterized protein PITG_10743 [Phytophthora infestans T30-4]EEY58633.1 conserved hypothetical protein [Phytophthora infestans T30-4]|eukprot:XP_002901577.1 conserved hypothetical protein [Phytophthora infestans T30-4]
MSDEFNVANRSFRPGDDHMWTSLDKPDGVNGALEIYAHNMTSTKCDDDGTCYFYIEVDSDNYTISVYNMYTHPPGYMNSTFYYRAAMVQSWNKFCFQGGMLEVRAQLPGAVSTASGNPDLALGKNGQVTETSYYPTWPGIWMMGNLGRAIFSGSTNRMWPFSYDRCEPEIFDPSNQRISACDDDPGYGMNPNQGRGAPEIDLLEGGGLAISSSLQIAPGMPTDFRLFPADAKGVDATNPYCVYAYNCKTDGANLIDVPTDFYEQERGHKSWYQGLRYAANNNCAKKKANVQNFATVNASVARGISENSCTTTTCPASLDVNGDLDFIDGTGKNHWGINSNGTCFPIMNSYMGAYLCDPDNTNARCTSPRNSTTPKSNAMDTFNYQMDAISANWPIHVGAYTGYLVYQLEWVTGVNGYARWMLQGSPLFEVTADSFSNVPQNSNSSNPQKVMLEEPMSIIVNVALSSSWGTKPPNPGTACRGDGSDKTVNKICDEFPMFMKVDYIRLYQDMGDDLEADNYMQVSCDPASHPTKEWIQGHIDEYQDDDNLATEVIVWRGVSAAAKRNAAVTKANMMAKGDLETRVAGNRNSSDVSHFVDLVMLGIKAFVQESVHALPPSQLRLLAETLRVDLRGCEDRRDIERVLTGLVCLDQDTSLGVFLAWLRSADLQQHKNASKKQTFNNTFLPAITETRPTNQQSERVKDHHLDDEITQHLRELEALEASFKKAERLVHTGSPSFEKLKRFLMELTLLRAKEQSARVFLVQQVSVLKQQHADMRAEVLHSRAQLDFFVEGFTNLRKRHDALLTDATRMKAENESAHEIFVSMSAHDCFFEQLMRNTLRQQMRDNDEVTRRLQQATEDLDAAARKRRELEDQIAQLKQERGGARKDAYCFKRQLRVCKTRMRRLQTGGGDGSFFRDQAVELRQTVATLLGLLRDAVVRDTKSPKQALSKEALRILHQVLTPKIKLPESEAHFTRFHGNQEPASGEIDPTQPRVVYRQATLDIDEVVKGVLLVEGSSYASALQKHVSALMAAQNKRGFVMYNWPFSSRDVHLLTAIGLPVDSVINLEVIESAPTSSSSIATSASTLAATSTPTPALKPKTPTVTTKAPPVSGSNSRSKAPVVSSTVRGKVSPTKPTAASKSPVKPATRTAAPSAAKSRATSPTRGTKATIATPNTPSKPKTPTVPLTPVKSGTSSSQLKPEATKVVKKIPTAASSLQGLGGILQSVAPAAFPAERVDAILRILEQQKRCRLAPVIRWDEATRHTNEMLAMWAEEVHMLVHLEQESRKPQKAPPTAAAIPAKTTPSQSERATVAAKSPQLQSKVSQKTNGDASSAVSPSAMRTHYYTRGLEPWCDHVSGRVGYTGDDSSDTSFQSNDGLVIYSPRKTSITQSDAEADPVVNQTTGHVSVAMEMQEGAAELADWVFAWRWQWICYGFFSTRARQLSRLERLTLLNVRVRTEDAEAMRAVMLSQCPEEDLLGLGQQEQQPEPREFSLKANASLRQQSMDADDKDLGGNASLSVSREIRGVKRLGTQVDKGWVDVLVPGFGKCQTRRSNLVHNEATPVEDSKGLSLMLTFVEDPDDELMCEFLGVIGGSLRDLTIRVSNFRSAMLERITATCPRLTEIVVCTPMLEARFQVRGNRLHHPIIVPSTVPSSFENTIDLVRSFSMTDPVARALRRLRVCFRINYGEATTRPPLEECCTALPGMLNVNRTLYAHSTA